MGTRLGVSQILFREVQEVIVRIIYIAFDKLNRNRGALAQAKPGEDAIVFVESERMVTGRNWHPERLFFLISSARHFAQTLEAEGFRVLYLKAKTTTAGLLEAKRQLGELPIIAAQPSSFKQQQQLTEFGVQFVEDDFFLTSRNDFHTWASKQKTFVMENFYRAQRVRLNILMNNGKPEGDSWNYDAENRLPPPKNYKYPEPLYHLIDSIDEQVLSELNYKSSGAWGTTRLAALKQLDHFLENNLADFGPYEDAVAADSWSMHHSLLSPYLNNGLLTADEVVDAIIKKYQSGEIPIASAEAVIRQIIGWREYINGMYWYLGEDYRDENQLDANRKLLPLFTDSTKTKMNCLGNVVADVEARAWTHHIPRLMILSNLALITSVNPQEFLDWMRENFIDAADWVMVPNIIGMAVHADGGTLMTKPYAAGGAYISRMTQYCKGCAYDPKTRSADDSCPFTTLYWDFLDRNRDLFIKNHRMSQQVNGLKRLADLPELRVRAKHVLDGLSAGTI